MKKTGDVISNDIFLAAKLKVLLSCFSYFKRKKTSPFVLEMIIIVFLTSCSPKTLTPEKFVEYILDESNGLNKSQTIGDFKYTLTYRPTDLLIMKEVEAFGKKDDSVIARLRKNYGQYDYYVLNISARGKDALHEASSNMEAFSQNLQNLSFRMNKYAYAITEKKDTLPLVDFYFPRLYGIGNSTQVMLAFDKSKEPGEYTNIYIEDIGLGVGRQIFNFKKEDIESVPRLKSLI